MILCSCNVISCAEVSAALDGILAEEPEAMVTPGRIFHRMGRRMDCARCAGLMACRIAAEICRLRDGETAPCDRMSGTG